MSRVHAARRLCTWLIFDVSQKIVPTTFQGPLREFYRTDFVRVVCAWGISNVMFEDHGFWGYCDAKSDRVWLRLDYDRGPPGCLVSPSDKEEFIGVDALPILLERVLRNRDVRWTSDPAMSLAAQCDFLIERKREIEVVVSPAFWEESKVIAGHIDRKRIRAILRTMKKKG